MDPDPAGQVITDPDPDKQKASDPGRIRIRNTGYKLITVPIFLEIVHAKLFYNVNSIQCHIF